MAQFVRGMKVTTAFGEGIIINLPIFDRIAVKYQDGVIRYFFQKDVDEGQIKPAHPILILRDHYSGAIGVHRVNSHPIPLQQGHGWFNHRAQGFAVLPPFYPAGLSETSP